MNDLYQPPTDNLYKFIAIGSLILMVVALGFTFRQQDREREEYVNAQTELQARGYVDESKPPTDIETRRAYFRRATALVENKATMQLAGGMYGKTVIMAGFLALAGFVLWWIRVQQYEDSILRATALKLERENEALLRQPS